MSLYTAGLHMFKAFPQALFKGLSTFTDMSMNHRWFSIHLQGVEL